MKLPKIPKLKPKQKFVLLAVSVSIGAACVMMYNAFSQDDVEKESKSYVKVAKNLAEKTEEVESSKASENSEAKRILDEIAKKEEEERRSDKTDKSWIAKPVLDPNISDVEIEKKEESDTKKDPEKILDISAMFDEISKEAKEEKEKKEEKKKTSRIDKVIDKEKVKKEKIELDFNRASYMASLESRYSENAYSAITIGHTAPVAASIKEYQTSPTITEDSGLPEVSQSEEESIADKARRKKDKALAKYLNDRKDSFGGGINISPEDLTESNIKAVLGAATQDEASEYPYREVKTVGDMAYAINNLPINSDNSSVVQFTLVTPGDMHGAVISGQFTKIRDEIVLQFNTYSKNGKSYPISAMAIDPDSYSSLFADDVDHHYFQRYGGVIVASLLEGYAESLKNTETNNTASGTNTSSERIEDFNDRLLVGVGKAGSRLAPEFMKDVNRPSTVHVFKNKPVGILFTDNFKVPYTK